MRRILFLSVIVLVSLFSFYGCDDENKILSDENEKTAVTDSTQISIVLNCDSLLMYVGDLDTLIATVRNGDDIVDYKVTWSTNNSSIAEVDTNGVVKALSEGTALITVKYKNVIYTCKVVVIEHPETNEYVDLGLSVLWATYNVGATKPEEFGDYYAWGEIETKTDYSWETYKWCNGSENTLTKYCNNSEYGYNGYTDDKYVLDPEDDVAHVKWGGSWRIPTREELEELMNNCSWTRDSIGSVEGFKVTGPSGNSIFIPAAGYYSGTEWIESETYENSRDGDLWSSTPGDNYKSYFLYFLTGKTYKGVTRYDRYRGWSVRPVCALKNVSVALDCSELSIVEGCTYLLNATVKVRGEERNYSVNWKSDNDSVVAVNSNGIVTALSRGVANITATYADKTASCRITVNDESEIKHEYVDLGLSVKWATFNVGATKREEYGGLFGWGETKVNIKSDYKWAYSETVKYETRPDYFTYRTVIHYTKYNNEDGLKVLVPEDDVAHVKWGGGWRMPTEEEWNELSEFCSWTWTKVNDVKGYRVTSNIEGFTECSIFLPAAGLRDDVDIYYVGSDGYYWSSSLYNNERVGSAFSLSFSKGGLTINSSNRLYNRFSVRPVCP